MHFYALLFLTDTHLLHYTHFLFAALSLLCFGVVTHTLTSTFSGSSESYNKGEVPTGNQVKLFDQSLAIGTNVHITSFNLKRTTLQSWSMTASTDVDIYTNDTSGGSPTDHITLKAGQVYNWTLVRDTLTAGLGLVKCPITADITAGIYITNAAICVLKIVVLVNE